MSFESLDEIITQKIEARFDAMMVMITGINYKLDLLQAELTKLKEAKP